MSSSMSTETLLNSFPMFGHPGISALEYAGSLEATRKRYTNDTSESLKRKSASTHDENTPPTTAGTEPTGPGLSSPIHLVDEFECQQRRRGTFLNHTPRDFEMRSTQAVEVYRPSRAPSRASIENYSRPRISYQANSVDMDNVIPSLDVHIPSTGMHHGEKRITVNHGAPAELDSVEVEPPSPEVYRPSADPRRRSASVPVTKIITYQPRSAVTTVNQVKGRNVRDTSTPVHRSQEKKRQRRQTPFKLVTPRLTDPARHTSLEPLVAGHQRKASDDIVGDILPPLKPKMLEEMGTFGVIQKYFDSQIGGPVPAPRTLCHACSPSLPMTPPSAAQELPAKESFVDPIAIYPIHETDLPGEPPAVPERSPKRLTTPSFPFHTKTTLSLDTEFALAARGEDSPCDTKDDVLFFPEKRSPRRLDVGQADQAGSSNLGRLAPAILSHSALTASSRLRLNDLNYYLRHTGPSPEPQPVERQRNKHGMKIFRVKQRKSLAARVGSVEGSPQRPRKQIPLPTCAREMTTSGGARHLKIIIPTDSRTGSQVVSMPVVHSGTERHSKHVSINFTEEMLNPLASLEVERMLSGYETPRRSVSEPVTKSPRSPKRALKSPKRIATYDHPLLTREESTRARKLRDLQRIKRKPLPTDTKTEQIVSITTGDPPTPAQTPEPDRDHSSDKTLLDRGIKSGHETRDLAQARERVVLLQRQNTELTQALARIVGLDLNDGDLEADDLLQACRQMRFSRNDGSEWGGNTLC